MSAANPYFHSVVGTTIQLGNIRRRTWVIFDSDGNMFRPLIEYFIEKGVGLMTQRHIAMAVGLYIDYMVANGATYSQRNNKSAFLSDFAWAIQHGTVHSTEDHTGLYWKSRTSVQARKILNSVCEFLDWLLEAGGLPATDLYRASTLSEKMAYWRYFNTKKQASLLNHIKFYSHAMKDAETTRRASIRRVSTG